MLRRSREALGLLSKVVPLLAKEPDADERTSA